MKTRVEITDKLKDTAFLKKMAIFLLAGTVVLTLLSLGVYYYIAANEEAYKTVIESMDQPGPEQMKFYGNVFAYSLMAIIGLFFIVVIFRIFLRAHNKHARLMKHGVRTFCKVDDVKIVRYSDKKGKIVEHKDVYIKTPLNKKGVYRFPARVDVETGDSLFIVYDPEKPEFFNIAYKGGNPVLKKKNGKEVILKGTEDVVREGIMGKIMGKIMSFFEAPPKSP